MAPWSQHPLISPTKKTYCDKELAKTNQKKDAKNIEIENFSGTL
jgi:hypothetical protein